jgi:hypothetical protein
MATSNKIFSLEGKGLKLTTAEDLEPHIAELRANDVEEVRLLGNTLGIGACKLLGEVLATKKNLRVSLYFVACHAARHANLRASRSPTLQISSQVASLARSPRRCLLSLPPYSTYQSSTRST